MLTRHLELEERIQNILSSYVGLFIGPQLITEMIQALNLSVHAFMSELFERYSEARVHTLSERPRFLSASATF